MWVHHQLWLLVRNIRCDHRYWYYCQPGHRTPHYLPKLPSSACRLRRRGFCSQGISTVPMDSLKVFPQGLSASGCAPGVPSIFVVSFALYNGMQGYAAQEFFCLINVISVTIVQPDLHSIASDNQIQSYIRFPGSILWCWFKNSHSFHSSLVEFQIDEDEYPYSMSGEK